MRTGTWDMVVLGGGVAGLAAARTARRLDAQVLLVDDGTSGYAASAAAPALI
ncbi:FAD-dependent oxidoreductase, partial [Micromonospora maritima]|uniref:FAD-dependent oxidoreductase n=1 Tax=Micromonospora maritima TaxID=986711 RepID=UPI00157CC96F